MANTADFKNGLCIEFNGDLVSIVSFQHVKPGKGPAFVRTKLKNLKTGRILENTFNSGVKIEIANVERRPYTFLYKDESGINLMHQETYEQIVIEESIINAPQLMKEGQYLEMVIHADTETPLYAELPPFVVLEVTYSEPGVRGDSSSTSSLKPATVETGATVMVPLFINTGEKIKIDTRDGSYSERVKE